VEEVLLETEWWVKKALYAQKLTGCFRSSLDITIAQEGAQRVKELFLQ
jgi:hypothetical protein